MYDEPSSAQLRGELRAYFWVCGGRGLTPGGGAGLNLSTAGAASRRECCPAGWDRFALSCYFFSRERRPWPEAEQWCRALGARLVVINTPAEQVRRHCCGKTAAPQGAGPEG